MLQYGYIIDSEILLSDKTNNKILIVPGALLNRTSGSLRVICKSPWIKVDMVALFLPQDVAQL